MAGNPPGTTCSDKLGPNWVDAGTTCRSRCSRPGPGGTSPDAECQEPEHGGYLWETATGEWVFSEFPRPTTDLKPPGPRIQMSIKIDEKNLAVGKARYTGAKHLNKYIAIHPGGPGNAGTPIIHCNIEFRIEVNGRPVPMTERRVRYWGIKFAPGATVANGGKWEVDRAAGAVPVGDAPSAEDAPGMNFTTRPSGSTGDMHEFLAGTSRYGGFYYQEVTMYDPDGTARVMVYNLGRLDAKQFADAIRRIGSGADRHACLFEGELTEDSKDSDSGILTDIPDNAKRKKIPSK
jgi:hypothetical protein